MAFFTTLPSFCQVPFPCSVSDLDVLSCKQGQNRRGVTFCQTNSAVGRHVCEVAGPNGASIQV